MSDEVMQREADTEEHRKSYEAVMKFGAEVGVPFSMALTMFFTQLVMANGWWSVVWFIVTYVAVWAIVKAFFSH